MNYDLEAARLRKDWAENARWKGIERGYTAEDVVRLRGSVHIEHTLARRGAEKLWKLLGDEPFVNTLGALTGNQALQQVKAGLKAIYLSGWQVAADANLAGEMYPDQSLYPANSVPQVVKRINNTLLRADQLHHAEGDDAIDFLQPIVADAEGQGGPEGELSLRLAGRGRREHRGRDVSGPVAVSGELGADGRQAHQQRAAPRRSVEPCRRQRQRRLSAADSR
jgi:isocitrate lyase